MLRHRRLAAKLLPKQRHQHRLCLLPLFSTPSTATFTLSTAFAATPSSAPTPTRAAFATAFATAFAAATAITAVPTVVTAAPANVLESLQCRAHSVTSDGA